jgi:hypothetical protein
MQKKKKKKKVTHVSQKSGKKTTASIDIRFWLGTAIKMGRCLPKNKQRLSNPF